MRGACHCGAVAFEVEAPLREVVICHCSQCRKFSGHVWAASSVPLSRFHLEDDRHLRWYRSSPEAQRGFCAICSAALFWKPDAEERIAFSAGSLEGATGLSVIAEIHKEDAGDYYSPDGPPCTLEGATGEVKGTCLCGANQFRLPHGVGEIEACHCGQCRKISGHYSASFGFDEAEIAWTAQKQEIYVTPAGGSHAFCTDCGSKLWFRAAKGGFFIEAGVLERPTGGRLALHIFLDEAGDYYNLNDGLPQYALRP